MAATLSASLIAHQKQPDRQPAISVIARDRRAGVPILAWQRLYRGAEADAPHAAARPADGSLLRARNDAGTLRVQRAATPGATSDFSAWTSLGAVATAGSGVALAARSAEALVLYTRGTSLYYRQSADNGATWAAEVLLVTEAAAISWIALAYRASNGDCCAFYSVGATVKRLRRTGGAWAGAGTAWSNTAASVTGLASAHDGFDYVVLVTGTEATTTHRRAWAATLGDGGAPANLWSSLVTIGEADAGSTTTFHCPSLTALPGPSIHGAFVAKETGNVAATRVLQSHPPAGAAATLAWTEPAPVEPSSAFGLSFAREAGVPATAFAVTASGVWTCVVDGSSDLSARLVGARVAFGPESARATIELDNADGLAMDLPGVAPGRDLNLRAGYASGSGGAPEYGSTWTLSIDAVATVTRADGRRVLVVECSGPWEQASRWRAPQAWQVAAGASTRVDILTRLAARVGYLTVAPGSTTPTSDLSFSTPSFALVQGEDAASGLRKLLAPVNDGLRTDMAATFGIVNRDDRRWVATMRRLAPVAWWRLHEQTGGSIAQDAGPAVANGSYQGGATLAGAGPLVAQPSFAVAFDGVDDQVRVTTPAALNLVNAVSVVALVKLPVGAVNAGLLEKTVANAVNTQYLLFYEGTQPKFRVMKAGVEYNAFGSSPGAADGAWRLFAGTYDGATVRIYIDGTVLATTATVAAPIAGGSGDVFLGALAAAYRLTGSLSEVAIFDRGLSGLEVGALQSARSPAAFAIGGGGEHPVASVASRRELARANWERLQGPDRYGDAFDAAAIAAAGPRREWLRQLDANTDTRALSYAAGALRRTLEDGSDLGTAVAPWHAGLELFDLVQLNPPAPSVATPAIYRVNGLALDYRREGGPPRYDAIITLGEP